VKNHFSILARLLLAALALAPLTGHAVPSFARQTGLSCIDCHTEFSDLNTLGRQFKLSGYTIGGGQSNLPPLAFMTQPSFTHTAKGQPGGAAPGFNDNNNFADTQTSVFYAGRLFGPYADKLFGKDGANIANKIGIFSQVTYDGVAKKWHWDSQELRYADTGAIAGRSVTYGVYLNNNPTMQDPWNSTPAWGFPFSTTGLPAQQPSSPMIDGALAQQVAGFGAYAFVDKSFYFDAAAYHTLGAQFQRSMGIDPTGQTQVSDLAPYWRAAYVKTSGNTSIEVGTFGLAADTFPGRDRSAGQDHTLDVGLDAQVQTAFGANDLTGTVSWIYERNTWDASQTLTSATNHTDNLKELKVTADYLYDKTYGVDVQFFAVEGSDDAALYPNSASGSPGSDGVVFQLAWLPFNKNGGPSFLPLSNLKLSIQYTLYDRINGAHSNYDGLGHNASDNNTLYLQAWIAF